MLGFDGARAARVLDVLRGGSNNVLDDRETAARILERWPDARRTLSWADRFSVSAAGAAMAAGMTGVVFGGTGFPRPPAPHRAALAQYAAVPGRPATWFAYTDGLPQVMSARATALERDGGAVALDCSVFDPPAVMKAVRGAALAAGPVQVHLGLSLAFIDSARAQALVSRWAAELSRGPLSLGSRVALLVPLDGYLCPPELADPVPLHKAGDAAAWIEHAGLRLLHPVADVRGWERQHWDEPAIRLGNATRYVAAVGYLRSPRPGAGDLTAGRRRRRAGTAPAGRARCRRRGGRTGRGWRARGACPLRCPRACPARVPGRTRA